MTRGGIWGGISGGRLGGTTPSGLIATPLSTIGFSATISADFFSAPAWFSVSGCFFET